MGCRENNMKKSLQIAQIRLSEVQLELESTKEAHAIVLETKESVLRQLVRQNSLLASEVHSFLHHSAPMIDEY